MPDKDLPDPSQDLQITKPVSLQYGHESPIGFLLKPLQKTQSSLPLPLHFGHISDI